MKVTLLMGGRSAERDISLRTGAGIAQALERLGHQAVAIDAADGRRLGPDDLQASLTAGGATPATEDRSLAEVSARAVSEADAVNDAEVVFLALHGGAGENGTVQALLELAGKPYTGSNVLASALAMNKAMSKRVFEREGIPTPPWILASADAGEPIDTTSLGGWPLVVKPNEQGSSVALSFVDRPEALGAALDLAFEYGREALIERFIPGRELTVAVLGDEPLPIVEIRPKTGAYDYESKYTAGKSEYFCPADLPEPLAETVRTLGARAARVLGCSGVCRVDFRLDPSGRPYCLEVNTIPGMTPTSLVPMAAKARGMSYDQLVQRMIELAQSEWRRRRGREPRDARART